MSLTISKDYAGFSAYGVGNAVSSSAAGSQAAVNADSGAGIDNEGYDTVQLSGEGRLLSASGLLNSLILPTEENARKLAAALSKDLGNLLTSAGISAQPPAKFSLSATGEIQMEGDRADKEQILEAVNANEKVKEEIRNTAAISSHVAAMADSLKFQREYLASNDPESVVAKYSYLFGSRQQHHHISLAFDGSSVSVLSDGKEWLSSVNSEQ